MIKLNQKITNKGITLIALVITIIVLLILAGVTIATLTSDNGLLNNSSKAKEEAVKAQIKEEIEIAMMDIQAEEQSKGRNVTLVSLAGEGEEKGQLENHRDLKVGNITANLKENEVTGKYKGYDYIIDENLNVYIGEKTIQEKPKTARYLIIEVNGFVGNADSAVINEIEIFDKNINKCKYTVLKDLIYDSSNEGHPIEWYSVNRWGYDNLNDGAYEYFSNYPTGYQNCTGFCVKSDSWARFVIDLGEEIEIGQVRVCVGGYDALSPNKSRTPRQINIYSVNNFVDGKEDNSTYAKNIIKKNDDNLILIGSKEFSEIITTPTWVEYIENVGNEYKSARYLLVQVEGVLENCDSTVINEIEVYNIYNEKIRYTVLKDLIYDSSNEGHPIEWYSVNRWGYDNLNDGAYAYSSNYPTGYQNCTGFCGKPDSWARFMIDLNKEEKIKEIILYAGGTDELSPSRSRTPKQVTFYKVNNFVNGTEENTTYSKNIKQKNNQNLELIKGTTFEELLFTPKKINLFNTDI